MTEFSFQRLLFLPLLFVPFFLYIDSNNECPDVLPLHTFSDLHNYCSSLRTRRTTIHQHKNSQTTLTSYDYDLRLRI